MFVEEGVRGVCLGLGLGLSIQVPPSTCPTTYACSSQGLSPTPRTPSTLTPHTPRYFSDRHVVCAAASSTRAAPRSSSVAPPGRTTLPHSPFPPTLTLHTNIRRTH